MPKYYGNIYAAFPFLGSEKLYNGNKRISC